MNNSAISSRKKTGGGRNLGMGVVMTITWTGLSFAINYISRFLTDLEVEHWIAVESVLEYVKSTTGFGLLYGESDAFHLTSYTDSNSVGSINDRKSITGYELSLGTDAILWVSEKHVVSLSSMKAEHRATIKGTCEMVWLKRILGDLMLEQTKPTVLLCHNQSVLKLAKNPVFHECNKHIDVHCHFIRLVENAEVELQYCPTEQQTADSFTKPLGPDKFVKFGDKFGVFSRKTIKGGCNSDY